MNPESFGNKTAQKSPTKQRNESEKNGEKLFFIFLVNECGMLYPTTVTDFFCVSCIVVNHLYCYIHKYIILVLYMRFLMKLLEKFGYKMYFWIN